MSDENKVRVYAPIQIDERVEKAAQEKASTLAFPEEKQGDLQYMRSVLVSAGTNKNGAHFLPSEMMKAHNTVVNKAIDIEHEEDKVIGHIYDCAYLYKDGSPFDPLKLMSEYEEAARDLNDLDIDIAVAGVIHKMRFPELSDEIAAGKWKVSMECYFKSFDLLIGDNNIITRDEAEALGYNPDDLLGGFVKVMAGTKALGKHLVARVLRHITFSGMGIVTNPANPHSIIMETASLKERMERAETVIDLEQVDNLRGHVVELSSTTDDSGSEEPASIEVGTMVVDSEGAVLADPLYIEVDKDTGGIKRVISVNTEEASCLRWSGPGIGGPGSILSYPDTLCKSFKKRLTKYGALDQSEGVVLHEHWCTLFEESCPVIGATAKAPECLRNQRNAVTKDSKDTTITKTVRDHLNDAPSNTFATVLSRPILSTMSSARNEQIARLVKGTEELRNSLREYTGTQTFEIASQSINEASVVTEGKVVRYKDKMKAFETAKMLEPAATREKVEGFILQVGPESNLVLAGEDRDAAVEMAHQILNEQDTTVVLSKLQSKFGDVLVTKDQLLLARKNA
jgi:hypothetical protein